MTDSMAAAGSAPVQRDDISQLAKAADGPVFVPGDDGYAEELATFNLAMRQEPAVVVGAAGAADVSAAIRFAAERQLPVGVLATGHGITLPADGAVLITTRRMNGVSIAPETRTAQVEGGVRSQQLTEAAAAYGLAALTGSSPLVSVVGLVCGGGLSPFAGQLPITTATCSGRCAAVRTTSASSRAWNWSCSRCRDYSAAGCSFPGLRPRRCSVPSGHG